MTVDSPKTLEISLHADAALRTVRIVLGVLSAFVVLAHRPVSHGASNQLLIVTTAGIATGVLLLNLLSSMVASTSAGHYLTQTLDVAATVGLVVVLDEPLGHRSWVLLVVPIVSAAVRHGAFVSVLSWIAGSVGYAIVESLGFVPVENQITTLARIPGLLLAVAITIGILARWMREGWEVQNETTIAMMTRERRLAALEDATFALNGIDPNEALEICAREILNLGFDAATIASTSDATDVIAVGNTELVADSPVDDRLSATPHVTAWMDDTWIHVHSVEVYEPQSRSTVRAWSKDAFDQDLVRVLVMLVDRTSKAIETAALLQSLRHAAAHDALTGLANRRALNERLGELQLTDELVTVAFVDLDDLKTINDEHGHHVGDQAIVMIARRLQAAVGSNGFVARYGGDEFIVVMPQQSVESMVEIAHGLMRTTTLHELAIADVKIAVGFSIGIASATGAHPEALLHSADKAVYEAKHAGKHTVVVSNRDGTFRRPVDTTEQSHSPRRLADTPIGDFRAPRAHQPKVCS